MSCTLKAETVVKQRDHTAQEEPYAVTARPTAAPWRHILAPSTYLHITHARSIATLLCISPVVDTEMQFTEIIVSASELWQQGKRNGKVRMENNLRA